MASIIKADNIQKVSDGSNIIKKCGSTTTIGSGACSPIVICGSTVTLGRCGGTVTLACGASQSGFGQTYSAVAYCTTAKTSPFTAAAGTGYFINTTCGAVTVTLPASPTVGDVVSFKDYAGQWNTNAVTLCNNGKNINGVCATASLGTQNQSVTLIYVDATKGWQDIQDSTAGITGQNYIVATGGTISTCGNYKIHTFTSDGCFTVSTLGLCAAYNNVDYLVVAGGGSGTPNISGGGGAGGYRESKCATTSGCWTASPLASATSLPVSVTTYPITVGSGGATGCTSASNNGSPSVFSTITSTGGGGGGQFSSPQPTGRSGGSGGGGGGAGGAAGSGNTPPVSPPQGNGGSNGSPNYPQLAAGGGGGATQGGQPSSNCKAGDGGDGAGNNIIPAPAANLIPIGGPGSNPSLRYYSGGAGGGIYTLGNPNPSYASGGEGGGGNGQGTGNPTATAGVVNSGGGGSQNSNGGSGVVIIRYRYQ